MTTSDNQEVRPVGPADASIAGVAFPIAVSGLYDYRVPVSLRGAVRPGTPVQVELGTRRIWGVVIELKTVSAAGRLKEIIAARPEHWTDESRSLISLYRWMAAYYQCDLGKVFRPLVGKGLSRAGAKRVAVYRAVESGGRPLSPAQEEAWRIVRALGAALTKKELLDRCGLKPSAVAALRAKGWLSREERTVARDPYGGAVSAPTRPAVLTEEQTAALEAMSGELADPRRPFLLHGITGSGKTLVYIELARRTLALGKSIIVLVPEISLTPQTVARFRGAVGATVAVIHSRMSDGERRDALAELVTGEKKLVIGARSAVLAPMNKVGLIVVDEEHDPSYKQTDTDPRYHARDAAVMRGFYQKALVVLGSATPSLESYKNAADGKYRLVLLKQRFGAGRLPSVRIVDMNEERRGGNWTVLSRPLAERMAAVLGAGRQIILLLNRRGYAVILMCKECGYTHRCPRCSVTLRFHRTDSRLKCHLCGHDVPAPGACPVCRGAQMKYQGTGIQKAEELLREKFPSARILRMDFDTTRRRHGHRLLLDEFAKRNADVLLGTQMVAKGLDFPGVALVGVLQADTGLLFPDFRASERTFQLLAQVAGRAGRSDAAGEVVIQTGNPGDPAIRAAAGHDYEGFYAQELPNRRELNYPPFSRLARVVFAGPHEGIVRSEAERAATVARREVEGLAVLGPSPAVLERVSGEYRYSLLIKSSSPKNLSAVLSRLRGVEKTVPRKMRVIIDVDPVYML